MSSFRYEYAVIGGDLRQAYLLKELECRKENVCHFALCPQARQVCHTSYSPALSSLEAAVTGSKRIICPIPFGKDPDCLNQSSLKKNISLQQVLSLLMPGQYFFAGCIPGSFRQKALKKDVSVYDLMEDLALAYFNTVATAEGVLCEAIRSAPINLHKSRCAVLGYGKCGRILADRLCKLSCHVTVVSSCWEELAQAALSAEEALELRMFLSHPDGYDFIFNTIPAMILTKEVLMHIHPQTQILDIASSPGGVDFAAAKERNIRAVHLPGLPGRYAPLSSARAILASIQRSST